MNSGLNFNSFLNRVITIPPKRIDVSISDLINPEPNFNLYRDQINFFRIKFEARFLLATTKLIKWATHIIVKFENWIKRDQKSQFILDFLIKFNFSD